MPIDNEQLENDRSAIMENAERNLKALADNVGLFRAYMDSFFAAVRAQNKIADDRQFYVILTRSQSGSHDVEEWRPGEPERYTVDEIEHLVLSADLKLGWTNQDCGLPGDAFVREKSRPAESGHRWLANVPHSSWLEMSAVLERLSEPLTTLDFVFKTLHVRSQEATELQEARKTIYELQRELTLARKESDRKSLMLRSGKTLKEAVERQWFKRASGGGGGLLPGIENTQVIDFYRRLKRSRRPNRGIHTRITHTV